LGKNTISLPKTYIFPEDYDEFCEDRENEENNVLYILKPVASSCGGESQSYWQKDQNYKNRWIFSFKISFANLI